MKSQILVIIEIALAILVIFYLLTYTISPTFNLKGAVYEDLLASLISLNYMNITNISQLNNTLYLIVTNILPKYNVFLNGTQIFNNTESLNNCLEYFYFLNGSVENIEICS